MADANLLTSNNNAQNNVLVVRNGSANKITTARARGPKYGEPPV